MKLDVLDPVVDVDQGCTVDRLLAAEVVIDHPLIDPGGRNDLIHGNPVVAVGRKQPYRGLEQATPRSIGIPISGSDGHIALGTASGHCVEAEGVESQQHGAAQPGVFSPGRPPVFCAPQAHCNYITPQPVGPRLGLGTFVAATIVFLTSAAWAETDPPVIPVGPDAYLQWELWPYQRIGARAYMRSTYDRLGGNEGADASHFLYQVRDDFNVTMDVAGAG